MSSPVGRDGLVILVGNNGTGTEAVVALEAATGLEKWRHEYPCAAMVHEMPIVPPGPGATPTIEAQQVFVLSKEGELRVLDLPTGKLKWSQHLVKDLGGKRPVYGYAQSPLVVWGKVFLDVGAEKGQTGSTVALDAGTGEVVWKTGRGEAGYSSARSYVLGDQELVAMLKGEALEIFDPATGAVRWSYPITTRDFANAVTPTLVGVNVLVSNTGTNDSATLLALPHDQAEAQPVWTHKQFALLFNSPIAFQGCLFGFNEKRRGHHEFTCVDAKTGETRWVSDAVPTGTFILADDHWLFLTREGEVVVAPASAQELKPSARFKALEGKSYATPALLDGRLIVRNNAGDVAAYDLRDEGTKPAGVP